jgi:hypothetical protein
MNTLVLNIKDKNQAKTLLTLHKQAKFWVGYGQKCIPWAFFVVNNGDLPNCDQVQQLSCFICFPNVVPPSLIENKTKRKRGIISYNTSFGTSSMKRHVKTKHLELVISYAKEIVVDNI